MEYGTRESNGQMNWAMVSGMKGKILVTVIQIRLFAREIISGLIH